MIAKAITSQSTMESIMIRTADFASFNAPVRVSTLSIASVLNRVGVWFAVAAERRKLAGMSGARLADMGLSDDLAMREASRPFWDAPARTL
jgi:uncharacterized protein YjiS (DUF1127 family)